MKHRLQYKLVLQNWRDNLVLLNLKFIFLHQPVDDKAKQEDQSEERSQGNDGKNDSEQFEVPSWLLARQIVPLGLLDVPEQNYDRQALREENNLLSIRNKCSDLQYGQENPVSPEESCFEEKPVEAEIAGDHHQLLPD